MHHAFIDKYSGLRSPIHKLDARLKFVSAFVAIFIMVSEKPGTVLPFAAYGSLLMLLFFMSRLPLLFVLRRLLYLSPFMLMAAAFYPLSHSLSGAAQASAPAHQVLPVAISIFLKALFSVSVLVLLISTAKFNTLLEAMRKLRLPRLIGILSALMYRYVFIFWDESLRTNLARNSRTAGKARMNRFRIYTNQLAMIFLRSWHRSRIVYNAMLSRGFTGEYPNLEDQPLRGTDALLTGLLLSAFLAIRFVSWHFG